MPQAIGLIVTIAAAAYSAYSAKQSADYQQDVANQQAQAAQNKAAYDENIHRERVRKLLSTQRALIGKSQIAMEGTPLLALQDTAEQGELDALAIRYGGDVDAARARSEGNLAKMRGRQAVISTALKSGSSLLSSGYNYYQQFDSKNSRTW